MGLQITYCTPILIWYISMNEMTSFSSYLNYELSEK